MMYYHLYGLNVNELKYVYIETCKSEPEAQDRMRELQFVVYPDVIIRETKTEKAPRYLPGLKV